MDDDASQCFTDSGSRASPCGGVRDVVGWGAGPLGLAAGVRWSRGWAGRSTYSARRFFRET